MYAGAHATVRGRSSSGRKRKASSRPIPVQDLGFKWIASITELNNAKREGAAQAPHADTVDAEVLEFVIALVDGFEGVHVRPNPALPGNDPKDRTFKGSTSRFPLARRRVIGALRLAHARRCANEPASKPVKLKVGDMLLLDASRVHNGPGPGRNPRWGMYGNVVTSENMHGLFGGRFVPELGVYELAGTNKANLRADNLGVRTAMQQAADDHAEFKNDRVALLCKGKKPCLVTKSERDLLDQEYGEEARAADNDPDSSWAAAIKAGRALAWDVLLDTLAAQTGPPLEQLQTKLSDLKAQRARLDDAISTVQAAVNAKLKPT